MNKNLLKITLSAMLLHCLAAGIAFSQSKPLPYFTNWASNVQKAGWTEYQTGNVSTCKWGVGGGIGHDYNVGANFNDTVIDWYVSPPLNFTSPGKMTLTVLRGGFSTPTPENCNILFGSKHQNPALGNFTVIGNISSMQPKGQFIDTSIDIP